MAFNQTTTKYDGITITIAIEDMDLVCWTGRMNLETWEIKFVPVMIQSEIRRLEAD
jgi:hypothetical protein